jgi:hypothetical protein
MFGRFFQGANRSQTGQQLILFISELGKTFSSSGFNETPVLTTEEENRRGRWLA